MASSLDLRFDVVSNMGGTCFVRLIFTNKGSSTIRSSGWKIYFNALRKMSQNTDPFGSASRSQMTVIHRNGYLHELTPTQYFPNLLPDRRVEVDLSASGVIVAKTDVMPNWYVVAGDLEPRILESTKGESLKFVGPFNSASKWKRSAQDLYDPFTPEKRFEINDIADLKSPGQLIIPTPLVLKYVSKSKRVDFNEGKWNIVAERCLDIEAQYLAGMFLRNVLHCLGAGLIVSVTSDTVSNVPQSGYCLSFRRKAQDTTDHNCNTVMQVY